MPFTQKKQPLISVIVPVYNGATYLPQCIESILAQTYTHLQIILINDGSTDNSGKICNDYATKDARIQVIHQANAGVSAARNAGLKAVRGEYIGFVDADDYLSPDMYSYLYQLLERCQTALSVCNFYDLCGEQFTPHSPVADKETRLSVCEALEKLLPQLFMWNKLFKTSLFKGITFDIACGYGEDMPVCLKLFQAAQTIVYGPHPHYYYRKHPANATSLLTWNNKFLGYSSNINPLLAYAKAHQLNYLVWRLRKSDVEFSVSLLCSCISSHPIDKPSALLLQQRIRADLLFFLFHTPVKISKKLFALCASINLSLTHWICLVIKKLLHKK